MKFISKSKLKKKLFSFVALFAVSLSIFSSQMIELSAKSTYETEYENYIYNSEGELKPAPRAYELSRSIKAADLDVENLRNLTAVFVKNDNVYVAIENAVLILDKQFNLIRRIDKFTLEGDEQTLSRPSDIHVDNNGNVYIAEPERSRILLFGSDGKLIRAMGKPEAVGLEDVDYKPTKLTVDKIGRIFVVSSNVYEGIMELGPNGDFTRFYGVNRIVYNPLDLFWRSIATDAQLSTMQLWLPTSFSNVSVNDEGFVFATVASQTESEPVKLLNSKGEDILRYPQEQRPQGDVIARGANRSSFIALDNNEYGMYTVLDSTKQRVFTYNHDGYLLHIFGGKGNVSGKFQNAVDVKFMGENIIVLDQLNQSIEVFQPTTYGNLLNQAVKADALENSEDSEHYWQEIAKINPLYDLAYVSMGDVAYREGEYDNALKLYKNANFHKGYSDAFNKVREQWVEDNISWILAAVFLIFVYLTWVLIVKPQMKKNKERRETRS